RSLRPSTGLGFRIEKAQLSAAGSRWVPSWILVIVNRAAAERSRYRALVRNRGRHVGLRGPALRDSAHECVEARHSMELVGAPQSGQVERAPQNRDRLVVDAQRHREWMAVLAAVCEGKARWI